MNIQEWLQVSEGKIKTLAMCTCIVKRMLSQHHSTLVISEFVEQNQRWNWLKDYNSILATPLVSNLDFFLNFIILGGTTSH